MNKKLHNSSPRVSSLLKSLSEFSQSARSLEKWRQKGPIEIGVGGAPRKTNDANFSSNS